MLTDKLLMGYFWFYQRLQLYISSQEGPFLERFPFQEEILNDSVYMLFLSYQSDIFTVAPESSGCILTICSDRGFDVHQQIQVRENRILLCYVSKKSRRRSHGHFWGESNLNKIRCASKKVILQVPIIGCSNSINNSGNQSWWHALHYKPWPKMWGSLKRRNAFWKCRLFSSGHCHSSVLVPSDASAAQMPSGRLLCLSLTLLEGAVCLDTSSSSCFKVVGCFRLLLTGFVFHTKAVMVFRILEITS